MNLHVRAQASGEFHGWMATRISANTAWQKLAAHRAVHLEAMSAKARGALRKWMGERFPPR